MTSSVSNGQVGFHAIVHGADVDVQGAGLSGTKGIVKTFADGTSFEFVGTVAPDVATEVAHARTDEQLKASKNEVTRLTAELAEARRRHGFPQGGTLTAFLFGILVAAVIGWLALVFGLTPLGPLWFSGASVPPSAIVLSTSSTGVFTNTSTLATVPMSSTTTMVVSPTGQLAINSSNARGAGDHSIIGKNNLQLNIGTVQHMDISVPVSVTAQLQAQQAELAKLRQELSTAQADILIIQGTDDLHLRRTANWAGYNHPIEIIQTPNQFGSFGIMRFTAADGTVCYFRFRDQSVFDAKGNEAGVGTGWYVQRLITNPDGFINQVILTDDPSLAMNHP